MSGHLEALTGWRDLCGQLLNPIEEQQRGEAAPWSSSFVAVLWGRVYFLEKYSDYFPLPRSMKGVKAERRVSRHKSRVTALQEF